MGQEISTTRFKQRDFQRFSGCLADETLLLQDWIREQRFSSKRAIGGFEIEAWLVNDNYLPAAINEPYIEKLCNPLVAPELSRFNVELNVNPQRLQATGIRTLHHELDNVLALCQEHARSFDAALTMIGILPTVRDQDLNVANMSSMKRYKALNEQVLRARLGRPMTLNIVGREHLRSSHSDVMLESAATSFQVHLQVPLTEAKRFFNSAIIASALTVAVSANSPYLFKKDLWDESRIPLFEQAVEVGGFQGASHGPIRRVTFGSSYVRNSIAECFIENLEHYPVLLPMHAECAPHKLYHLRLHNGTIWRWNRPLVGFDDDGTPHLRVEHRVMPSGPTVIDQIANAAFFYGLVEWLSTRPHAPEAELPFATAKSNFYEAARLGLRAPIQWLSNKRSTIQHLVLEDILPAAETGLKQLQVDADDIDCYLGIVEARVRTERNGSNWQRAFIKKHGLDMQSLTKAYVEIQQSGQPVHQWTL